MRQHGRYRSFTKQQRRPLQLQLLIAILALLFFVTGLVVILPGLKLGEESNLPANVQERKPAWPREPRELVTQDTKAAHPSATPTFMRPLAFLQAPGWLTRGPPEQQSLTSNTSTTDNVDSTPQAWKAKALPERVPIATERGPLAVKDRAGAAWAMSRASAQDAYCDEHFGETWLRQWNATAQPMCSSPGHGSASRLKCRVWSASRSMWDAHMTEASGPHVLCDATRLLVDPSRFNRARCPKHRRGYLCQSPTYHRYARGAFGLACAWPSLRLEDFPKDHLRDIMEAVQTFPDADLPQDAVVETTRTLLATREIHEHANVFHTLADLLNVYITLHMLGWEGEEHQVLLLDSHPAGPLDPLWAAVAASGGLQALRAPWNATGAGQERLLRRAGDLGQATVLDSAAFVPPGYTSLLFAHLYETNSCPQPTSLFRGFRRWLLAPLGLDALPASLEPDLQVTLISRQPMMDPKTRRPKKMVRRISNEEALLQALQRRPGVSARLVDLASLTLMEQLTLITETDILVGMHGAALAWGLVMRDQTAVLELWPKTDGIWRCYEHTSEWAGLHYRRWGNSDPSRVHMEHGSDSTEVDVDEVGVLFKQLVSILSERRE